MSLRNRCQGWIKVGVGIVFFSWFAMGNAANAANSGSNQKFSISVQADLITLHANAASLKSIILEMGKQLGVPVKADVSDQEKVTISFNNLPVKEALKRLTPNYAVLDNKDGKIAKIILFPRGDTAEVPMSSFSSEPEPDYSDEQYSPVNDDDPPPEEQAEEGMEEGEQQALDTAQEESSDEEATEEQQETETELDSESAESQQNEPFNLEFDPNSTEQTEE